MDHITTTQLVLGVTAAFTIGLGIGAAFAVLLLHDSLRAIREERALIDRWDQTTSSGLLDRFAEPEPLAPVEPEPEVLTPSAADISIADSRTFGFEQALRVAALMGALMQRNHQGPARIGRHAAEHRAAGHELLLTLLTSTQQMPVITAEVA